MQLLKFSNYSSALLISPHKSLPALPTSNKMKLILECDHIFLGELYKCIRAACSHEFIYLTLQDDLLVIQDEQGTPSSWVEVDIPSQKFFKTFHVKSKAPKNRIVLKSMYQLLLEVLASTSAFEGTKVTIKLAAAENRVYLEFKCEVPQTQGLFLFEKQLDVVIERSSDNIIPQIPNTLECELTCVHHLQQMILPLTGELALIQVCLTVCKAADKRDLDYVFNCEHNRRDFKLPSTGKLTIMSRETSPLQVISAYFNLNLQQGQCSLYSITTLVKAKDLVQIFQRTSALNWNKVMLGVQHESEVVVTACWKESLFVRFLATAHTDDS